MKLQEVIVWYNSQSWKNEIEKKEEILNLEWFQEKSVENLLNAIDNKKNISITTLLISLAISWVGKKTAQELSKLFTSSEDLLDFSYNIEEIENLDDIWPEIAKNMQEFFTNSTNKKLLENLVNILNIEFYKEKVIKNTDNIFFWKKVCITWSFWNIKRPDLIKSLEEVWWNFVTSVSKNTDFLVALYPTKNQFCSVIVKKPEANLKKQKNYELKFWI